ncbi:uncharacterized protein LOC141686574 [Apium graveolens]|uniref:uncharacterized protein LOC141686574 n=1 Tax=Apium graveolens TaxID=4045 RepID=UPI003D7AD8E0
MNPGSPDSEFGNFELRHDFIVPTYKRQRLQEAFFQFNHGAETPLVRDDEMTSWIGNPPLQNADFSLLMEDINSDEFVHGLPQQIEVKTPTPAPQAKNAPWPVLEPPIDISDFMPLDPSLLEPLGSTSPAEHNSSWAVSPLLDSSAPLLYETAAEATSVVAAVEGAEETPVEQAEATPVVAAVEGKKEGGSPSIAKEENQVGEQDDGIGSSTHLKRKRENHNGSERRRRDKLKERMEQLRQLVGCKKPDKASLLEETCTYLISLQNHVNMLSSRYKMRTGMAMGMGMNMAMVPFPAFVPGSTLQNPANTAAQLPTVVHINGQYFGVYPTVLLQAEPSSSNNPGKMEDTEEPNK